MKDLLRKMSRAEYNTLTEEQKKERARLQQRKSQAKRSDKRKAYNRERYRNLTPEQIEIKRARDREYYKRKGKETRLNYIKNNKESISLKRKEYLDNNSDKISAKRKDRYKKSITHYVVYKHTSPEGAVYIGEGSNRRPYNYSRDEYWHEAFNKDTIKVEILHTFKTKEEAQAKEKEIINEIGINNLINKKNGK